MPSAVRFRRTRFGAFGQLHQKKRVVSTVLPAVTSMKMGPVIRLHAASGVCQAIHLIRKHESRFEPFFIGNFTLVKPCLYLSVAVSSELYRSAGLQPQPAGRFLLGENDKVRGDIDHKRQEHNWSTAARDMRSAPAFERPLVCPQHAADAGLMEALKSGTSDSTPRDFDRHSHAQAMLDPS
ncbi:MULTISPECIES: hypothetical protein [Sinorhizobium]|uniref:Uncharacterized protein n=1 Tax=Sinorhizobium americanum TaxID=194963 RepID=A0A2S3YQJ9_9HYPH|nr:MULTISPECIES: hypothetical protein [Sinorhizobium]PDT34718.1 hypothetical protein CO656_27160 [Sinorhizobium sp. FG01]PDT49515.1 hypothetical protein CO664_27625 [Sinorhizobium sp. NG07B]POH33351.1 hypothetical protein ATY30_02750 [Sinorhizobium americanum]POH33525.1 hypothetical protein ATY31_10535 [Sinorhizobium americanum]